MTDSDEKITYSLDVSTWAHPAGRGPVETSLVRGSTPDPTVAAATLRAVADRLDPPRPAYRRGDHLRAAVERCAGDACNEGHTYRIGCLRAVADRRNLVTPDGCGPERTFTGSCYLAVQNRTD